MVSLKRKWDENIWKIIVFSLTILIAIGFVATATYFYNINKEKAILSSVIFDPASTTADIRKVTGNSYTWTVTISYDALNSTYTANWGTGNASDAAKFATDIAKVATNITTSGAVNTYKAR